MEIFLLVLFSYFKWHWQHINQWIISMYIRSHNSRDILFKIYMQTFPSPLPTKTIWDFLELEDTYHCGKPRPKCTIDNYIHVPILLHFQDISDAVYPWKNETTFYSISQNIWLLISTYVLEIILDWSKYTIVKNRIGILMQEEKTVGWLFYFLTVWTIWDQQLTQNIYSIVFIMYTYRIFLLFKWIGVS